MPDSNHVRRPFELAAKGRSESVEQLTCLVRIPSLTGEEGEAQDWIAARLRDIGLDVLMQEPDVAALFSSFPEVAQYPTHWRHDLILPYEDLPSYEALQASGLESVLNYKGRSNVVGVLRGAGGGRSLILNGHVDTVTIEPSDEWTKDPFGAEIDHGLMYGRGTSDMKGGVMAALMALTFVQRSGVRLRGDVIFQSVVNEEHAGNGSLDLIRRGYTADAAVVLEPTNNRIAVSHSGGLYWQVTVPGCQRSPGARWNSGYQEGVSAIEKLPSVIEALLALERCFNERADDDVLAADQLPFSLVMGKISGGFYETVTAGQAILRGSAYFAPGMGEIRDVMRAFCHAIDRVNADDAFLRSHPARLEFLHHDDSSRQSPQIPIAVHMGQMLAQRGGDPAVRPGPFCCDMRHLVNQGRIPSIIFGPGTITQAHKPDEHINLQEYLDCIEHLISLIVSWCEIHAAGGTE